MRLQAPIHSGFDKTSTASQVIAGLPLTGKTAIITGGHSGLGLECTKALAKAKVNVIVAARDVDAAKKSLQGTPNVLVMPLNLADLASVEHFSNALIYRTCFKNWFWATRKLSRLKFVRGGCIALIQPSSEKFQPRGFGAAENPIFETRSV